MRFVTDFADQAVVLPVAAIVLLVLLATGWRRGALAWAACVAGTLVAMLVLKLLVFACGGPLAWTGLASPSGHTAAAAVVYGGLAALLAPASAGGMIVAAVAGCGFALVFGLTRLALEVHTIPDVMVGAIIGVTGAVVMRRLAGARPAGIASPRLALAALAMMLVFHGHRLNAEPRIHVLALDVWPLTLCR